VRRLNRFIAVERRVSTYKYLYDANGNMRLDRNKGITIHYNMLNLPDLIEFDDGRRIEWIYAADGTKLRKKLYDATDTYVGGTDYVGAVVYDITEELAHVFAYSLHDEGRVVKDKEEFAYVYNICDHLGSTRVSFMADTNDDAVVLQRDSYYPFGLQMPGLSYVAGNENPYLYNGENI